MLGEDVGMKVSNGGNEKGFKETGGRGRGPGGNWETLGGKWGRMRRASRGLGQGDQEATGRHWDGSGGE